MREAMTTPHSYSLSASRPHVRSTSSLEAKRSMFDMPVAKSTHDYGQFYDGLPGTEDGGRTVKHMYSSDYDIGTLCLWHAAQLPLLPWFLVRSYLIFCLFRHPGDNSPPVLIPVRFLILYRSALLGRDVLHLV